MCLFARVATGSVRLSDSADIEVSRGFFFFVKSHKFDGNDINDNGIRGGRFFLLLGRI